MHGHATAVIEAEGVWGEAASCRTSRLKCVPTQIGCLQKGKERKKNGRSRRGTRPPPTAAGVIRMTEQFHFPLAADVTISPLSANARRPFFLC